MKKTKSLLFACMLAVSGTVHAQYENSGISAGFFDSSENTTINFSTFHLPPLAVLFENAKENPTILEAAKAHELAVAEVAKQKRHIFSYVYGHASYSYGKADMWGNNSTTYSTMIYQFQGSEQSYWNVGVNISVPLEDILDLGASVKRKRLEAEMARYRRDQRYDELKQQIGALYAKITTDLVALKTMGEAAAIYQGAGLLNQEQFHQGEMEIQDFAYTKLHETDVVSRYQAQQNEILTNIITMEILTHTPILTNTTTEVTLEGTVTKTQRQLDREKKALEKRIRRENLEEQKRLEELEKAEREAKRIAEREAKKKKK
ncbi:MAG: TolC family protein [Prevotella sp.]|nr:TolC family protein [Prevotella sp.]